MRKGFWKELKKPLFVLAPMANVTDAAFRRIIAKYGKPDVMWTEFVSCDGLCSRAKEKLLLDLWFSQSERPIVAQVFGSKPESFYKTAQLCQELGFDGIDINMGCPDRNVEKQGGGAQLMKNPTLGKKIIAETQRGAGPLPVSVKTRIGYNTIDIDSWIPHLLETGISALTIHGRTRKEMSKVPAHWDVIGLAVEIAKNLDSSKTRTLILGNGDVETIADAEEKIKTYGIDGVMIGRGIFGNPWLFDRTRKDPPLLHEKLSVLVEHVNLFEQLFSGIKSFEIMKKHFKAYVIGFDGAKELRAALMQCTTAQEVAIAIDEFFVFRTLSRDDALPAASGGRAGMVLE